MARYRMVNENLIPNGNRPFVDGTDIDFREKRYIDNGIYHSGEKYRHYTVYEFHKIKTRRRISATPF